MYKSGYVILLGDVNVGKSSLINRFLKKQLLIVSGRKGSTINKILCILNINNTQIVFIDTPGFLNENFKKKSKYIFFLNKFDDVDIFLYIVIPSYKIQISNYKKNIIKKINKNKKKVFLIINKIELFSKKKILFTYFFWKKIFKNIKIFNISIKNNINIKLLLNNIIKSLKSNIKYFCKKTIIVNKTKEFIINEYIRDSLFLYLRDEIPYNIIIDSKIIYINNIIYIKTYFLFKKKTYKKILLYNFNNIYNRSFILIKKFFKEKINMCFFLKKY